VHLAPVHGEIQVVQNGFNRLGEAGVEVADGEEGRWIHGVALWLKKNV
jgi:hypothetical protein